jgi:hypothetical protein
MGCSLAENHGAFQDINLAIVYGIMVTPTSTCSAKKQSPLD